MNDRNHEIDLRDYIETIFRRKKILAGFFCVSVFFTGIWGIVSPRVYEISMIIEPPISAITDTGVQTWDSVANIKAKIEAGVYNVDIIKMMSVSESLPRFAISLFKDTRLIKVGLTGTEGEAVRRQQILEKLLETMHADYAFILGNKRDKIDNDIKVIQNQIDTKENEIKLKSEQLKILEARDRQFVEDIQAVRASSEKLQAQREAVFNRKDGREDVATLFYSATMQQNTSYLIQLQNDLAELRNKKGSLAGDIEKLKNSISEGRIDIRNLSLLKDGVQNIRVIQAPGRSLRPVGPKRTRNTLLAGAIGLMIGLIAALSIEWWERPIA